MRSQLANVTRIVIKIGTNVLMGGDGKIRKAPDFALIEALSRQVIGLNKIGKEVILVSSGAIGFGMAEMEIEPPIVDVSIRQACAAIGQPILMQTYKQVFNNYSSHCAQLLLTGTDFNSKNSYEAFSACISTLLNFKVVPIINENDSVAIDEIGIQFGDNDNLSAIVAAKTNAELLILLTDVDSVFDKNPRTHTDAKRIDIIEDIDAFITEHPSLSQATGSKVGTGGIHTKLRAARYAHASQCKTIIAAAHQKNVIIDLIQGKDIGTLIL